MEAYLVYLIVSGAVCGAMIVLGLILCCIPGFFSSDDFSPLSHKQVALGGILLVVLGVLGLCFPWLVMLYFFLLCVILVCCALFGVYRAFAKKGTART